VEQALESGILIANDRVTATTSSTNDPVIDYKKTKDPDNGSNEQLQSSAERNEEVVKTSLHDLKNSLHISTDNILEKAVIAAKNGATFIEIQNAIKD
jgi:hypothetical protein